MSVLRHDDAEGQSEASSAPYETLDVVGTGSFARGFWVRISCPTLRLSICRVFVPPLQGCSLKAWSTDLVVSFQVSRLFFPFFLSLSAFFQKVVRCS